MQSIATVVIRYFFSYPMVLVLLAILGAGGGIATFIESMYDTQTAKLVVYDARWYETIMLLLTIVMIGLIYRARMWKRMGAFLVHSAFVVILVGAFMTRYFGYEGIIHLREGSHENEMLTVQAYLQVEVDNTSFEYPLSLGQLGNNDFSFSQMVKGKPLVISYKNYRYKAKGERATLFVDVRYGNESRLVKIDGGAGWVEEPAVTSFNGLEIAMAWGAKVITLPFSLALRDFQLERYPGSMSPSSYASEVDVLDGAKKTLLSYRIFMNHPLHHEGYTFFQSSYDTDEKGSILEINKDPGKWPTYLGYFLLSAGFLMNFFTRGSRFFKLRAYLKNVQLIWVMVLIGGFNAQLYADASYLEQLRKNSLVHAQGDLSELLVQDFQVFLSMFFHKE